MRKSRIFIFIVAFLFLSQISNCCCAELDPETHTLNQKKEVMFTLTIPINETSSFYLNATDTLDFIVIEDSEYLNYRANEDYIAKIDKTDDVLSYSKYNSGTKVLTFYIIITNPHDTSVKYDVSIYYEYEFDMQTKFEAFKIIIPQGSTFTSTFELFLSRFNLYILEDQYFESFWADIEDNLEINSEHTYRINEQDLSTYTMSTTASKDISYWFVVEYPDNAWGDVSMEYAITPYDMTGNDGSENSITGFPLIFTFPLSAIGIIVVITSLKRK